MTREELFAAIRSARPAAGDVTYLERRGESYAWHRVDPSGEVLALEASTLPDAWICYSGEWPLDDDLRWREFCDDLLAEMESMAQGADRCRWPLDEPWPRGH